MHRLVMLGDSDISRWPADLRPEHQDLISRAPPAENHAAGGAVMSDLLTQLSGWRASRESSDDGEGITAPALFLCCAGENDVGSGRPVDAVLGTLRRFLDEAVGGDGDDRLIFVGPKLEPWLAEDAGSRKLYAKLNTGLARAVRGHPSGRGGRAAYVECLTSFCTEETSTVPGAVYGNRAVPDGRFFDGDMLHLNDRGYRVWKRMVEDTINKMLDT